MSFDSKSTNFRAYIFDEGQPDLTLDAFAGLAIPPVETLRDEPLEGWSSPRFLLDRELVPETCRAGKYIRLSLAKALRKIPRSLLDAYSRMEEIRLMRDRNASYLSRDERRTIREEVKKQMLPKMPPTLTGISVAIDLDRHYLYSDSLSESAANRVSEFFAKSAHKNLFPLTPEEAALRLYQIQADSLDPVGFSTEPNGDFTVNNIGLDFLMWLFYRYESGENAFDLFAGAEPVELALEGPVSLVLQGQGAHLASLSQGEPLHSVECKAALLGGKKIASVTLVLDRGGDLYRTRIDGQTFHFRQFTGPAVDANRDDGSLFLERMQHIQNFTETFYALYGVFLKLRTDDAAWDQTLADIRAWLPTLTAAR